MDPTASGQRIKSLAREKTGVLSLALRQSSDEGKTERFILKFFFFKEDAAASIGSLTHRRGHATRDDEKNDIIIIIIIIT